MAADILCSQSIQQHTQLHSHRLLHLLQLIKLNFYVIIIYRMICRFYIVINYNRDADADFADTENDVSEERINVSATHKGMVQPG